MDIEDAGVAPDDSKNHRQTESRSVALFGGKEGFETAIDDFFGHAFPRIFDADFDAVVFGGAFEGDDSTGGHGVDGIENQVDENFSKFGTISENEWDLFQFQDDLNGSAGFEGLSVPLGLGKRDDLL